MTFYALQTAESAIEGNYEDPGYDAQVRAVGQACGAPVVDGPYGAMTVGWQAFPTGQQPPPAVSPEDLAAYAYEVMDLKRPGLEWNPHLASSNDATLVNLPTWLWTRDPAAVEERQVTAEAAGVSVTVTAQPNGMTVTTPVGGTECSAKQAGRRTPRVSTRHPRACSRSRSPRFATKVASPWTRRPPGRRRGRATPARAATWSPRRCRR